MAATAHGTAAVSPAYQPVQQHAQLLASAEKAAKETTKSGLLANYTVRSGDTLSSIAKRYYNEADAWPAIFWANKHQIRWANIIQIGQRLRVPVKPDQIPAAPSATGPPVAPVAAPVQQASAAPVQARCAGSRCAGSRCAGSCRAGPCRAGSCRAGCAGCHLLGRQLVPAVRDRPRVGR